MSDYIPKTDAEKIAWLNHFTTWLLANGGSFGFNTGDLTSMQDATNEATTAFTDNETAKAAAIAATATKNNKIGEAIALARQDVRRLQASPQITDGDRGNAGITIPDDDKSVQSPDYISEIPSPILELDFSIRHQVIVHWGPTPGDEQRNAKPHGVSGCEIQYAKNEEPQEESGWTTLGLDTASPYVHHVNETTATTYIYRARYVDKKLRYGSFGDPVRCTVSV